MHTTTRVHGHGMGTRSDFHIHSRHQINHYTSIEQFIPLKFKPTTSYNVAGFLLLGSDAAIGKQATFARIIPLRRLVLLHIPALDTANPICNFSPNLRSEFSLSSLCLLLVFVRRCPLCPKAVKPTTFVSTLPTRHSTASQRCHVC